MLLDTKGRLVLCQHGDRRMARMNAPFDAPAANFETIAATWEEKRFNSPNDAVFSSNGKLYITDPAYGMELRYEDPRKEMDYTGVFLITPGGEVSLQTDKLSAPNGIGFSPDGEHLGIIRTGQATSNCTLDAENRYLYMTANIYLMRIRLR